MVGYICQSQYIDLHDIRSVHWWPSMKVNLSRSTHMLSTQKYSIYCWSRKIAKSGHRFALKEVEDRANRRFEFRATKGIFNKLNASQYHQTWSKTQFTLLDSQSPLLTLRSFLYQLLLNDHCRLCVPLSPSFGKTFTVYILKSGTEGRESSYCFVIGSRCMWTAPYVSGRFQ